MAKIVSYKKDLPYSWPLDDMGSDPITLQIKSVVVSAASTEIEDSRDEEEYVGYYSVPDIVDMDMLVSGITTMMSIYDDVISYPAEDYEFQIHVGLTSEFTQEVLDNNKNIRDKYSMDEDYLTELGLPPAPVVGVATT